MAPLTGTRVLDLSRLLPGPYASLVLSDLGAEVVKIEDPGLGDYLRELPGMGGMFAALNRGKKSIAVDLKAAEGKALFEKLAAKADVLLEGFRPGVMEKLGFEPKQLCERHPKLIVCSISGFGQTGDWRGHAGHDIGYLALAGVLARCGAGERPELPGVQLADLFGGAQAAVAAILAALLERARTGRGQSLDISMTEGVMGFLLPHLGSLASGQPPQERGEDVLSGSMPCYRVYLCKDRRAMALGALEPKFWLRFCAAINQSDWEPRQFDRELTPQVDALFAGRTRDEWTALLGAADCCAEPVLEPRELESHPLHAARDLFVRDANGLSLLRSLPAFGAAATLPTQAAPTLGQQTHEVLAQWGIQA